MKKMIFLSEEVEEEPPTITSTYTTLNKQLNLKPSQHPE